MEYRTVANTDIQVSPLCLGTMTFGNPVGQDAATRLVHQALDQGINFYDTADMYEGYDRSLGSPGGVGETLLGQALKGHRPQAVITTKVGNPIGDDSYSGTGLSPAHIHHQIDASLSRLQTDWVDFYQLHRPDPDTPLAESIATMAELIEAGKIRHWGFSNFSGEQVLEMVDICDQNHWPRPVINQPYYNWLQRAEESNTLQPCRHLAIAITPYRPLEGGLLTGKYRPNQPPPANSRAAESAWLEPPQDELQSQIATFETEAATHQLQPAQYAVRWLLEKPGIPAVVVGAKRFDQVEPLIIAL